jgi:hypothetical protein
MRIAATNEISFAFWHFVANILMPRWYNITVFRHPITILNTNPEQGSMLSTHGNPGKKAWFFS